MEKIFFYIILTILIVIYCNFDNASFGGSSLIYSPAITTPKHIDNHDRGHKGYHSSDEDEVHPRNFIVHYRMSSRASSRDMPVVRSKSFGIVDSLVSRYNQDQPPRNQPSQK